MRGGGLDLPFQDQPCYLMTSLPSASLWTRSSFQHLLAPFNFLGFIFLLHSNSSSTQRRLSEAYYDLQFLFYPAWHVFLLSSLVIQQEFFSYGKLIFFHAVKSSQSVDKSLSVKLDTYYKQGKTCESRRKRLLSDADIIGEEGFLISYWEPVVLIIILVNNVFTSIIFASVPLGTLCRPCSTPNAIKMWLVLPHWKMQFKAKELNPHIIKNKVYFGGETKWVQIMENNWIIFFKYST